MHNLLAQVNLNTLFTVVGIVAAIAILFAVLIMVVSHFTAVKTDEKVEQIQDLLSNANCGGCGFAGCADFAKALAEGKADISSCGPTAGENKAKIAAILGKSFSVGGELCAFVHCIGGNACADKFLYVGNEGCDAKCSFAGGNKACAFGCLGEGTCASVCDYDAIKVVDGVAQVNPQKCVACGKCVKACPKHIIELLPKDIKVVVACSSLLKGKDVMAACKNGCIGCGLCAKNCPKNAIEMVDNLPKIDYAKCTGCLTCSLKCPRKCIREIK
ncbi:MAG: RnfABCDGE type electron transport complex subunit B [Clostridia bacterium]|nr:RnfABCDGE type electron transport complex subunit B [Clostridia bacterium]